MYAAFFLTLKNLEADIHSPCILNRTKSGKIYRSMFKKVVTKISQSHNILIVNIELDKI